MKYAGIINNDVVNGQGVCVSFWSQGCPHRCPGCHNPNTWDYDGGIDGDDCEVVDHIINMIHKNGIQRNLSILGGEPLCNRNLSFTYGLITKVKEYYPDIKIFIWTGYSWEDLLYSIDAKNDVLCEIERDKLYKIIKNADIIVDGKFIKEKRDITLPLRGSSNQRIIDVQKSLSEERIVLYEKNNEI